MTVSLDASPDYLTPGYRVPNFALPVSDGRVLILYEFATEGPLLLAVAGVDWPDDVSAAFAEGTHARARARGLQSVAIVSRTEAPAKVEGAAVTVADNDGALRRQLFGGTRDGALLITDPNLRVVTAAAMEREALQTSAGVEGMEALVVRGLEALRREQAAGPSAAPVLIVPRVLPAELCRSLVERFEEWSPQASPMPQAQGSELAVDATRKARLDATISDVNLERDLMLLIGRRVRPELQKAFCYPATRFERVKLVCYRAEDHGHFGAHRDNTAPSTAHRRFALTLNLNSEGYEGGELEFPEYGADCAYAVATGAAIVFSGRHAHRVRPVTRGSRFALITFAFGDEAVTSRPKKERPDHR